MKKNNALILAIVAVVAIAGVTIYAISNNSRMMDDDDMMHGNTAQSAAGGVNKNSSDYTAYNQLKGEDYDQAFLANMIIHHQGAVDMAQLALTNAKHHELKDMANAIITAQNREITNMKHWQNTWGYSANASETTPGHMTMGMMDDMVGMTQRLKQLTGDEFDKVFLSSMIMHHQSAINMAYPGQKNAMHQEVKDLTKAIVGTQGKEIMQMKQWQNDWAYTETDHNVMSGMNH